MRAVARLSPLADVADSSDRGADLGPFGRRHPTTPGRPDDLEAPQSLTDRGEHESCSAVQPADSSERGGAVMCHSIRPPSLPRWPDAGDRSGFEDDLLAVVLLVLED